MTIAYRARHAGSAAVWGLSAIILRFSPRSRAVFAGALIAGSLLPGSLRAGPVDEFYRGRNVTFLVGEAVGGGYDGYSRLVAAHIGRHIPGNPAVVVQNMPGGAGVTAANHLYVVAPKDGTVIGMLDQGLYLDQALGRPGLSFDVNKFNWIGRVLRVTAVLVSWHTTPVKTVEDLKKNQLIVSATGASSRQNWAVLNAVVGTKLKIIGGYTGTNSSLLALERGEIEGCSSPWVVLASTKKDWLQDKKVNVLLQTSLEVHPDLVQVPRMVDLAPDPESERILRLFSSPYSIGRSVVAPPGLPDIFVAALRQAFDETLTDPAFQAHAANSGLEIDSLSGKELQALITAGGEIPAAVRERARSIVRVEGAN
jgi:tripartite-type tricarboxylate transporter receptor subunit TctC